MRAMGVVWRLALAVLAVTLAAPVGAEDTEPAPRWQAHGSLQASGDIHSRDEVAPSDALVAPAPSSTLAAAVDLGREGERGGVKGTLLGILWDPTSGDDRGAYGGLRARLYREPSPEWRFTAVEDARLQRHAGTGASDFQRQELGLTFDRRSADGAELGVRFADRRRGVPAAPELGFSRDSVSLVSTLAPGRATRLRLEGGGEHESSDATSGARLFAAAALAHVGAKGAVAVRVEAYSAHLRGGGASSAAAIATPPPVVTTQPPVVPTEAPARTPEVDDGRYLASDIEPETAARVYTGPELPVDALLVQPFEEEDDWDFGRARFGVQLQASRDLGGGWQASGYVHAQHRSGTPSEDRLWLRAALRRRLTARWSLLLQTSRFTSRVSTPGADFTRTLGGFGIQYSF